MSRVIAIIGTAGRDKSIPMDIRHWDWMCKVLASDLKPEDVLVSGGAAWADHVAVWAYLNNLCKGLILHFPAPFNGTSFEGDYGTSGNACNYYHGLFSRQLKQSSMQHLQEAITKGAITTSQRVVGGYGAMFERNKLVARDCDHMLAFTFGEGDIPADGGTKMTWDMAAGKERLHVSIPKG